MLNQNKTKLIVSSVLILLPIIVGLLLWNQLPDVMTTHWGVDNQPDGWSSKAFAVFAMPLILLATHWFCLWITTKDPGQKNQNKKAIGLVFWMIPMVSLFSSSIMYGIALGNEVNIGSIVFGMLGLMFLGIGNYLPKVKQNYTLGIKVSWALANEENWNATHRFSGKVWVAGGLLLVLAAFFPMEYTLLVVFPVILILALVPMLYSWLYYKKQCREGRGYEPGIKHMDQTTKIIYRWSMVIAAIILIGICFVMFTGKITYVYGTDSFTVDATYHHALTVKYDTIDEIEYREGNVSGIRSYGFASLRLLLGFFENEEFGTYTRYTYYKPESCIVVTSGSKTLVISGENAAETQEIYHALLTRIG